jgi:hypothetical protein
MELNHWSIANPEKHPWNLQVYHLSIFSNKRDHPRDITSRRQNNSFRMIIRVLGMAKATVAEHYTRYLAEQCSGLLLPGRLRRLTKAITVMAIESFENKITCTYSDMADFAFESFGVTLRNQWVRFPVKCDKSVKVPFACPTEDDLFSELCH